VCRIVKSKARVPIGTAGDLKAINPCSQSRQRTTTTAGTLSNSFIGGEINNRDFEGQLVFLKLKI
jgi:hypothetical protein